MTTTTETPTLNEPLFEQIKAQLLAAPEHFNMRFWYKWTDEDGYTHGYDEILEENAYSCENIIRFDDESCGTTGCIAGYALCIAKAKGVQTDYIESKAAALLGLTYTQGSHLFHRDEWLGYWGDDYNNTQPFSLNRAQLTCDYIDFFIQEVKAGRV